MSDPNNRKVTRDFTRKRPLIEFTIDEDEFRCKKALDLTRLQNFMNRYRDSAGLKESEAVDAISSIMKLVLRRDSYVKFSERFTPSDDVDTDAEDFEPIDHTQVIDIIRWVMEQYTGRPTEPSPSSSAGSENGGAGTSSTVGASPAASTSTDFPLATPSTLSTTT